MATSVRPSDYGIYGSGVNQNANALTGAAEIFCFLESALFPATPVGGTFNFTTGVYVPPSPWTQNPPQSPAVTVWVSSAVVTPASIAINWSAPGQFGTGGGGGGTGTVQQVLGTAGDITVAPAAAGQVVYTVDLATLARTDTVGTTATSAITAVNTDTKGRVTGVVVSPISGGGGGGGAFTSSVIWTGGTSNKDAFTAPSVVNNVGITINLVASSGSGGITAATVSLNGVALTNAYASTGTWPNLVVSVPAADLTGNAAETAAFVTVSLIGTFNGGNFNVANAGTLTNNQPIPFTTVLSGSFTDTSLPFYNAVSTLNYSYTNSAQITSFGGTFTPASSFARNATSPSGSFASIPATTTTIGGSATGFGLKGAPAGVVITLSGTVAAVPTYIPAFYQQTNGAALPAWTTASLQTTGAAAGSTISYNAPPLSTYYNWVATQRPLSNLQLTNAFGGSTLIPNVSGSATIGGQTFAVYGWSGLSSVNGSTLVIS